MILRPTDIEYIYVLYRKHVVIHNSSLNECGGSIIHIYGRDYITSEQVCLDRRVCPVSAALLHDLT